MSGLLPNNEKIFPNNGKIFPNNEKIFPNSGKIFHNNGKIFPNNGKIFPNNGKIFLQGSHGLYIGTNDKFEVLCSSSKVSVNEELTIIRTSDPNIVTLQSCHGKYLSAQMVYFRTLHWNRPSAGYWEQFEVHSLEDDIIELRSLHGGRWVTLKSDGTLAASIYKPDASTRFTVSYLPDGDMARF